MIIAAWPEDLAQAGEQILPLGLRVRCLMIFDCHVHLPSPGLNYKIEWAPCTPGTSAAITYLRRCGVNGIVANSIRALVAQTPGEVTAGNNEIVQIAAQYPGYIVPACEVNTNFPRESIEELHRCHTQLGVFWLGELAGYFTGFSYATPAFRDIVKSATDLNMVVQIHDDSVSDMAHLLAEFPRTTFILSHLGDSPQEVKERIGLAVRFPNLCLDISGHGYQRMGVLELAVRQAGADRVLFGSDYTINDPAGVIARIQLADFDAETREKLLGGNLLRLLGEHGWKG